MKNFKKVIAFLMVAAMILGMGTVAFADGDPASVSVSKIEVAKAGDVVNIQLVAAQDMFLNSFTYVIALDENFVEVSAADVAAAGANQNEFDEWNVWKLTALGAQQNYNESGEFGANYFALAGAETALSKAQVKSGTVIAELAVKLKADVKADDVIATVKQPNGYRDDKAGAQVMPADVDVVVSEKTTEAPTEATTAASEATAATTAAETTAAATTAAATTAAATAEIKTAEQALAALTTLDKAVAASAKLNKASFASEADYQAFVAALEAAKKVLNNPKATDAEKAAALATLKAAMAKANETALVAAAKAALTATTANGKTKTGDTAPVAALMLVAIAAFGTAVVVYRKKVNA